MWGVYVQSTHHVCLTSPYPTDTILEVKYYEIR